MGYLCKWSSLTAGKNNEYNNGPSIVVVFVGLGKKLCRYFLDGKYPHILFSLLFPFYQSYFLPIFGSVV